MQVFRIPKWDNDSGVTHVATTWEIATDKDFENIIDEVDESEEYLNYYKSNIVVPEGKIYYVRAKRKFEEVDNNVWIGPKPIVSEESGLNEIIKPPMTIDTPYVTSIVLDYEDGLTITLAPFSGGVPHQATNWIIKNPETNEIIFMSLNDTENKTELNIPTDDIDFTQIPYIKLTVNYVGSLGLESPVYSEIMETSKRYYELVVNKKIVDSSVDYTGELKQTTSRVVTLKGVELLDMNGNVIANATISDNTFTISSLYLVPKATYYVRVFIYFDNDESTLFSTQYSIYTKDMSEKISFQPDRKFNEVYKIITKDGIDSIGGSDDTDRINRDTQILTEETYIGIVPLLGIDGKIKAYFYSKADNTIRYIKDMPDVVTDHDTYIKLELMDKNYLYVERDKDGNKILDIYKFNPYTYETTPLTSLTRDDEVITDFNQNAYGVLNNEFYWASIDANDKTQVMIRKYDVASQSIVTLFHGRLDENDDKEIDNISFGRILGDRFLITPHYYNTDEEFFGYSYDVSKNETYKLITIPKEVRTQHVVGVTLDSGNFMLMRVQLDTDTDALYFAVFDAVGGTITTKEEKLMIDEDLELDSLIRMKSSNVLQFGFVDDKFTDILWS